jgi:hypothetical protein
MALAIVFSAASLLICGFSFIYFQAYLRRRTGAKRILAEFEEEVNNIVATIDAAADRDITLVEERVRSLKTLLDAADRRIAAYAREMDSRASQETAYAALNQGGGLAPSAPEPPHTEKPAPQPAYSEPSAASPAATAARANPDPVARAKSGGTIALPLGEGPRFIKSPSPVKPKPRPLTERVSELSQNGLSPEAIASRLGVTISEVDLALAVSERRQSAPGNG